MGGHLNGPICLSQPKETMRTKTTQGKLASLPAWRRPPLQGKPIPSFKSLWESGQPQKTSFLTGWSLTILLVNGERWVVGLSPAERGAGKEAAQLPAASLCQRFLTARRQARVLQAETEVGRSVQEAFRAPSGLQRGLPSQHSLQAGSPWACPICRQVLLGSHSVVN